MRRSSILHLLAWITCVGALANKCPAEALDSADFDFKYNGSDIYDGATFLNHWSVAGDVNAGELLEGASIELNERGNIVMTQTPDNRNFWLQQDSDASPWEEGVGDAWSLEVRAHLVGTESEDDLPNNGFVLWGADGFQRGIATIQEDSSQSFGRPGEIFSEETNDDGFHTFRMNYDADEDLYLLYRDGTLISEDGFFAQAATGNTRLIVGDCCTNANDLTPFIFEEMEIEYIRYDLDGAFDPVEVEPVTGDFNNNGTLDIGDINMLVWESASGENDTAFDLNDDNNVNTADVTIWAKDLKGTWIGDSDLDGEFGSGDLVTVFTAGKYEQDAEANWSEGDWTGDHRFDSGDLVAAFTDGGYELGPPLNANAVPEPSSIALALFGMLAPVVVARRRQFALA